MLFKIVSALMIPVYLVATMVYVAARLLPIWVNGITFVGTTSLAIGYTRGGNYETVFPLLMIWTLFGYGIALLTLPIAMESTPGDKGCFGHTVWDKLRAVASRGTFLVGMIGESLIAAWIFSVVVALVFARPEQSGVIFQMLAWPAIGIAVGGFLSRIINHWDHLWCFFEGPCPLWAQHLV